MAILILLRFFFCVVGQKKMCRQSVGCRRVGDITFQFVVCREFLGTGLVLNLVIPAYSLVVY